MTYEPEVLSPVCAPGARYFSTILWVYKGALNAFGVVMAAKTWTCADGVGEVRCALVTVGCVLAAFCAFTVGCAFTVDCVIFLWLCICHWLCPYRWFTHFR